MVSRGKRIARKYSESAMADTSSGSASSAYAAGSAYFLAKTDDDTIDCGHCESPSAAEELELTPCCHMLLCSICYELEMSENEQCPNPACLRKLAKIPKPVSVMEPQFHQYKKHFIDEPSNLGSSTTVAAKVSLSDSVSKAMTNEPAKSISPKKSSTASFATAQASPPKASMPLDSLSDSAGSEPWDDEKAQEARQTLEAATAHLIDVYNAMGELLSEEERGSIIRSVVVRAGVSPDTHGSPTLASQSPTLNASADTLPAPEHKPEHASMPDPFEPKHAEVSPFFRQTQHPALEECMSCASLRSKIQAVGNFSSEDGEKAVIAEGHDLVGEEDL